MKAPAYSLAALLAITSLCGSVIAAPLAPHRAVYDIKLKRAADRTGIESIRGRMVFDFNGSACEGFTTRYRFVMEIDGGGEKRITDQQTATHEDGDGGAFSFSTRNFVNSVLDGEIRGHATAQPHALSVELSKPREAAFELPQGHFPTSHLLELIERAGKNETQYETAVFDGSDDANAVLTTSVFISRLATPAAEDPEKKALGILGADRFWPVSVAYFVPGSSEGDAVPLYRIDFKLHDNGVTRDLLMDYGDYTLAGQLIDLKLFDPPACR